MARFQYVGVVQDSAGNAQSGIPVTVIIHGGGAATLYPTEVGGSALTSLVTDLTGSFMFWADNTASYDVTPTGFSTRVIPGSIPGVGGPPSGAAGGDLTGTFPSPTITALAVTDAKVAAANKDGTASTPSMRTLGPGAQQAMVGSGVIFGNGATLAQRDTLYGYPTSPAIDTPFSSLNLATSAASKQWAGGFFGVISASGSTGTANNVGLYGFAREDRVAPTAGTWGLNVGATNNATAPGNVQGAEIDINNMGTDSGSTASGAQPVHGITVASGGTKRPLDAVEVVAASGAAPFYYGVRFAEGSVYGSGAVVQSLTATANQIQWEAFLYTTSYVNPTFRFNAAGKMEWGPGTGALDTNFYRSTVATLKTDGRLIAGAGIGAYGVTPPAVQPARAVTLADCIAVLAGAGLTA